jgi:hypothetical protein
MSGDVVLSEKTGIVFRAVGKGRLYTAQSQPSGMH